MLRLLSLAIEFFLPPRTRRKQEQSIVAFDRGDGAVLWQVTVSSGGFPRAGQMHQKGTHANGTLACDGERLFAAFLANDEVTAYALDMDRQRSPGGRRSVVSIPSSGMLRHRRCTSRRLFFAADNRGGGCLAALDRQTGKIVWA